MKLPPVITSRTNERVKALRASFTGKAGKPGDVLGIEGEHLIGEVLRSWPGKPLESVFVREGSEDLLNRPGLRGLQAVNWFRLSRAVFDGAVGTETPQGIAATIVIPRPARVDLRGDPGGVVLVLENIQDPGNFGTLLRSAEAFGVRLVLATTGCVNAWNAKVLRASAGSVFRVPLERAELGAIVTRLDAEGVKTRLAAVAGREGAMRAMDAGLAPLCALMIGNEGAGLSQAALAAATGRVHIPAEVESLNAAVAGSILLYEALRQRDEAGRLQEAQR